MDNFINVTEKDPQVRIKTNNVLDRYNSLRYNYQSKLGHHSLIQNVILKEIVNLMSVKLADIDIELKMKISRIEDLESKLLWLCSFNLM